MFRLSANNNLTKLHRLAPQVTALGRTEHVGVFQLQKRNAGIASMFNKLRLDNQVDAAKKKVNANPNDENLRQYFYALNATKPSEVIANIEKGWTNGTVPITEPFLKQYFAAAAKLGRLESVNISGLLALLARGSVHMPAAAEGAPGALSEAELSALIRSSLASVRNESASGAGGAFGNGGAGSSPTNPLYTTT